MNLYLLKADVDKYASFSFDQKSKMSKLTFQGQRFEEIWESVDLINDEPKKRWIGFASGEYGTFVLNKRVKEMLEPILIQTEILDANYREEQVYLINPPTILGSIEMKASEFREYGAFKIEQGIEWYHIEKLILKGNIIDSKCIFRNEVSDGYEIFVTQPFVDLVQTAKLKGFVFELVGKVVGTDESECNDLTEQDEIEMGVCEENEKQDNSYNVKTLSLDITRFENEDKIQIEQYCKQCVDQLLEAFLDEQDSLLEVQYAQFDDGRAFDLVFTIIKLEDGVEEAYEHCDTTLVQVYISTEEEDYSYEEREDDWQQILKHLQEDLLNRPFDKSFKLAANFSVAEMEVLD